ncbi:MAG: indoleacetamide hydrolase [Curvibacter sp.]|nr:indoleacetamide hydrolase [Curvibacter sp.]
MTHPMAHPISRRILLQAGALAAGPLWAATPPSAAQQRSWTATQALNAIHGRQITAQAYVQTLIERAEALSGLNALICLDKAGALAAAARVDARIQAGESLPPLAGLPLVVKDNINTRDLPTTGGTPALRDARPQDNAPSLQKLLDAGAIVLGKANLHELAFGITSTNFSPFAGPVCNPYDRERIPGGSSGGTAAAIAGRLAPAGLGTDTGGSSRIPAALCGIAGLRPSVGNGGAQRRYHDEGAVVPISHTRDTIGPMARSVGDLALLDSVITGTPAVTASALSGLRLGVPASFWQGLDRSVAEVMERVRAQLRRAGVVLVDEDLSGVMALNDKISFPLALHEPREDIPAYLKASGLSGITLAQVAAGVASPDVKGAFDGILADAFGAAYPEAIGRHRPQLQALYADYLGRHRLDGILFPTTVLTAAPIDRVKGSGTVQVNGGAPQDEFATYLRNTDPGSNAGIPGLSLFAGMSAEGLPVGLEIDGAVGSDRRLLAIGMALEDLLGLAPAPLL